MGKGDVEAEFSTDFSSAELKADLVEFREEARRQQQLLEFKEEQQQQQQQIQQQQQGQLQQQQGLDQQRPSEDLVQFTNSDGAQGQAEMPGHDPSTEPDDEKKREEEPFLGVRAESSRLQIEEQLKTKTTSGTSSTTSIPLTESPQVKEESDEKGESPVRMQLSAHSE